MIVVAGQILRFLGRTPPEMPGNLVEEGGYPLSGCGRNGKKPHTELGERGSHLLQIFPHLGKIDLVDDNDLRLLGKLLVKKKEFPIEHPILVKRIPVRHMGEVEDVEKKTCPLHMLEKAMPETGAQMRPLNETGDISNNKRPEVFVRNDSQIRCQGSKRIVGYLRTCRRNFGNERRLPYAWKSEQPHIRQELQLQPEFALLPRLAGLGEPGSLVGGSGKSGISLSAATAAQQDHPLPRFGQIRQHLVGFTISDNGTRRNRNNQVFSVGAMPVLPHPVNASTSFLMGPLPKVQESGKAWRNLKDYVTTLAAVTAVRPSLRDKLLPPEGDAPSAAVTCP
jgi:hypothetical protein